MSGEWCEDKVGGAGGGDGKATGIGMKNEKDDNKN